jgi:solute carrier family 25 aspartate/glutamate transporter 12/13
MSPYSYTKLYDKYFYNNDKNYEYQKAIYNFSIGLLAGCAGAFAVYPIDVIKTKMQNQVSTNILYKNGFDCCKKIWLSDGIYGFYRGSLIQLIGVGPEKAVKLFAYKYTVNDSNKLIDHFYGGIVAGTCQVMITCPYEMIKINMQMKNNINLSKLYTGISACFLRDIPFSGMYFPTYFYLKEKLNYNSFLSGTIAGAPAAFLCTPADVIKTRMQTLRNDNLNPKIIETIKSIYNNEGVLAFFKGSGWRVIRSSPQFGITLFVYEYIK